MSYATDKKAKFMKDQKNPLRLLARVFRDTPMMRLRSIYAHAVEMFPRLSVYITTRPENTPEWQLKIEAIRELFSDPGFRLRFAMVEGAQLFDTIEESETFRYPESANESSHTRRVYLEMRLRSPFILSDDDPGENRNGRYYPKTYAGMVEADNHFAGGASQYLKLTPRSFFVIWQTLFYLGTLRCASYVGLNASNDSTKPASGWRACGRNHNRSHSDYSVRPVSFNAPITGIQGIISGVRDSTKCKKAARLGVFQEHSSASAEAVRQAISKGQEGTITLRSIKLRFAVNPQETNRNKTDLTQMNRIWPGIVKTRDGAAHGLTDVTKNGCIVYFQTTAPHKADALLGV